LHAAAGARRQAPAPLITPALGAALLRWSRHRRNCRVASTGALPGFGAELGRLPKSDESLVLIDNAVLRSIAAWPDPAAAEKARFSALATGRRGAILVAVNRAEAGQLPGRIYEGPRVKLEFFDATRMVITEPGAPPEAGTYTEEPDGRVIVTAGGRSVVMTREGRRLTAGPLEARRVKSGRFRPSPPRRRPRPNP
jgi:hypothetical protein